MLQEDGYDLLLSAAFILKSPLFHRVSVGGVELRLFAK
jgi:hypothetical protein